MKRISNKAFFIGAFFAGVVILAGCGGGGGSSDTGTAAGPKSGDRIWSVQSMPTTTVINEVRGIAKAGNILYAVGYDTLPGGNQEWRIEKRSAVTGSSVATIVSGSTTTFGDAKANAIVTEPTSSSMFVVGYDTDVNGFFEWRIEKRDLTTGLPVSAFGTGGVVTSSTGSDAVAYAVATGPTSTNDTTLSLYIAGYSTTAGGNSEWRIEKRDVVTGTTITVFGLNGVVTNGTDTISPGLDAEAYGIAVGAKALYVVGYDTHDGAGIPSWRIEIRDLATGASMTAIRSLPVNAHGCDAEINGIAIDQNNMYVVGYDIVGDCTQTVTPWDFISRIEKRDLTTGALINNFGTSGVALTDLYPNYDTIPYAISIDANNMYIGGYGTYNANFDEQWRIEKRDLITGNPVSSFGTSGVVLVPATANLDSETLAIAVDDSYFYAGGFDTFAYHIDSISGSYIIDSDTWRIEKRLK